MVVRIRLARFGKRHKPFYNIVVSHARTARNSKPLEVLGTFDPLPQRPPREAPANARPTKAVQLDVSRAKYWLGVGAQPSDGVWELLEKAGLLQPKLRKQEARWRAKTMDELFAKVGKGEMSVEEMVAVVPTLQFVPEQQERKGGAVEKKPPVEAETRDSRSMGGPEEMKQ